MEIMSISPQNVPIYGFSFFLLINLVGVILGYWSNKKLSEGSFGWILLNFFFRSGFWSFLICYAIIWLAWFASNLIVWYGADDIWFMIVMNISFFCRDFFWLPSTMATAIYGMRARQAFSDLTVEKDGGTYSDKDCDNSSPNDLLEFSSTKKGCGF